MAIVLIFQSKIPDISSGSIPKSMAFLKLIQVPILFFRANNSAISKTFILKGFAVVFRLKVFI
jgi:hypothetical protein